MMIDDGGNDINMTRMMVVVTVAKGLDSFGG
jgi:hypothetical protein